jgi:hypothetical protein
LRHSITRADKDIVQFLSWSLLLAPHAVQGSAEEYLPREKKGSQAIALLSSGRNAAVL